MNLIDRCFEGAANVPKRLLKVPASIEKAEEHLEKANRNLIAAKLMNDNKFFDWTISCAYYAMYHATMASIWLIGIDARSHECAIAAFEVFYVKRQKVDKEYLEYVKKAKSLDSRYSDSLEYAKSERIKASYGLGGITSTEADRVLSDARDFVAEITRIVYESKGFGYQKM
ncbi:MAG: HEPN domain-containing protein [Candidatus Micrarchaeota archaeon]